MASGSQQRVLLLGAGGKLGRMVRAAWPRVSTADLICVARTPSPDPDVRQWTPGESAAVLPPVDVVLALWGVARGNVEELAANTTLALAAQRLAADLGAHRVIHCSSSAVYPPSDDPHPETAPLAPSGAYGRAKADMEGALAAAGIPGPPPTILRIGNVAGAESLFGNMRPGGIVRLDRFADGRGPRRSYIGPTDLARMIAALVAAPEGQGRGIFNVAAHGVVEMGALSEAGGCHIDWRSAPPGAIPALLLDTTRMATLCALPARSSDPRLLVEDARTGGVWP